MMGQNTDPNKKAAGRAIGGALMMIVLGFLAALLPHVMGASASVSLGWIILVSGFAYFFYAFAASSDGEVLWRMVIGFFISLADFICWAVVISTRRVLHLWLQRSSL